MIKWIGRLLHVGFWLAVVLIVLMIAFPLAMPYVYQHGGYPSGRFATAISVLEKLQNVSMHIFAWAWIFFLGGCFASFLNVVAWRVPRGKSILGSSHCPQCDIRLGLRSNVPVFGWFRNDGKCANCDLPIPPRYVLAEIILGSAFLILFLRETISGGVTIPAWLSKEAGIEFVLLKPKIDLLLLLGQHLTLLAVLFAFALVRSEKMPIPVSVWGVTVLLGVAFFCVPAFGGMLDWRIGTLRWLPLGVETLIGVGCGIAAAIGAASLLSFSRLDSIQQAFWSYSLVGIFLGWQSTLSVLAIHLVLSVLAIVVSDISSAMRNGEFFQTISSPSAMVFWATLIHFCCWKQQRLLSFWPGPGCNLFAMIFSIAIAAGIAGAIRNYNGPVAATAEASP